MSTVKEKISRLKSTDFDGWQRIRRIVENEISEQQGILCCCGAIRSDEHDKECERYNDMLEKETFRRYMQTSMTE